MVVLKIQLGAVLAIRTGSGGDIEKIGLPLEHLIRQTRQFDGGEGQPQGEHDGQDHQEEIPT